MSSIVSQSKFVFGCFSWKLKYSRVNPVLETGPNEKSSHQAAFLRATMCNLDVPKEMIRRAFIRPNAASFKYLNM